MSAHGGEAGSEAQARTQALAEIAGLHGAFTFSELLLQRIWSRGDFEQRGLRLRDGRSLRLRRRGRWNRLAGPDFADAELEVGDGAGCEVWRGAVEAHLRASDWEAHGHSSDPAYAGVVLHVVLFPSMREWTEGVGGRRIPILELLPLLGRDLEAYAEEAAVEGMAGRPYSQLREVLAGVSQAHLREQVAMHARRRWTHKVRLAASRIERLGWEAACHQVALEVLGYRPNRAPMLEVAEAWPLEAWRDRATKDAEARADLVEAAFATPEPGAWVRAGVRPANQPKRRLAQYADWVGQRPDWPERLAEVIAEWAKRAAPTYGESGGTGQLRVRRRVAGLPALRRRLSQEICAEAVGGTRFDTLVCDGWLPLCAARAGVDAAEARVLAGAWADWQPGDLPEEMQRLAREFEVGGEAGETPAQGDLQGLIGWLAALARRDGRGA
ncbi:MAG: DUF2851 family protein [Opitutaceae bacterium]|jgi:hypothetical protein|nr:DUF2851 family protein [Opitutaceae bacterium]